MRESAQLNCIAGFKQLGRIAKAVLLRLFPEQYPGVVPRASSSPSPATESSGPSMLSKDRVCFLMHVSTIAAIAAPEQRKQATTVAPAAIPNVGML